jgi:F420-dependent oxidoreductase-like protein
MKIGLQVPCFTFPGGNTGIASKLADIAQTADGGGFASLWVMDHFFQLGGWLGEYDAEMLEAYSTLSYLAGLTKNVKLGTMVTGVIYRYPGILAKTVTTLDVLSQGRAYLGIGAAWYEREAHAFGVPFPPLAERFELLEEALQIVHQMWSDNNGPYQGKHYQLAETFSNPQPISTPHPPILIGGMGEKKTFRLIAKYGNACNLFAGDDVAPLQQKLDALKQRCDEEGRDYNEIEKTTLNTAATVGDTIDTAKIVEICRAQAGIGIQHAIFNIQNIHEMTQLEVFVKDIIPAVSAF